MVASISVDSSRDSGSLPHACQSSARFFSRWPSRKEAMLPQRSPIVKPSSDLFVCNMKHACVDELNCMHVRFIKRKLNFLVDMKFRDVLQKLPSNTVAVGAPAKVLPRSNSQVRTFGLCVSSLSRTIFQLTSPCQCLFDHRRTKRHCCKWPNKFTVRLRLTVTRPASCWFEITDNV